MTESGYRARLHAIEWHANLWVRYGVELERAEAMRHHISECLDADFFGVPRPDTDDPEIERMKRYLDDLFDSPIPALVSFQ